MASQSATRFAPSATSTWLIKAGPGTVYGALISPSTGGTVVLADLLDVGATPNLANPSTFGPGLIGYAGPFGSGAAPLPVDLHGQHFSSGLSISATSTTGITVEYD